MNISLIDEELNIYDMTRTTELNGIFYEKLKKPINKYRYREMRTVCSYSFAFVSNKKLIAKLDKIFPPDVNINED